MTEHRPAPSRDELTELGKALARRFDITDEYLAPGSLLRHVRETPETRRGARERFRDMMRRKGRLGTIGELAAPAEAEADQLLRDGLVSAVDGTAAIRPLELPTCTLYGVAVAVANSREAAVTRVAMTGTEVPTGTEIDAWAGDDDLWRFVQALEASREGAFAWTGVFREYVERETALQRLRQGDRLVLIDGPIYTQNLMLDPKGLELLERLHEARSGLVGYAKGLSLNPLLDLAGRALEPGEAWIVPYSGIVGWKRARERSASGDKAASWARSRSWSRVVYKARLKHFAIECDETLAPMALAMLTGERASGRLHHEVPFLLEMADGAARRAVHPDAVADQLRDRVFGDDYAGIIGSTDERTFR